MTTKQTKKPGVSRTTVRAKLHEMAIERGPGAKLPTKQELRGLLKAGQNTIEDALAELEASRVIYRRRGSGIYVSPKLHQKSIRLLFDSRLIDKPGASPFWGILWGYFAREAQRRAESNNEEFQFQLVTGKNEQQQPIPDNLMSDIESGQLHGVLSIGLGDATADWTVDVNVPHVSFAGPGHWQVITDASLGMKLALGALATQGCKSVAVWHHGRLNTQSSGYYHDLELRETQQAYSDAGLAFHPSLVSNHPDAYFRSYTYSRLTLQEQGYYLAISQFGKRMALTPDGIFLGDDLMTEGLLVAFAELGIRAGVDVHVASASNLGSPILFGADSHIIRVVYDPARIVASMFEILDILMAGGVPESAITSVEPILAMPASPGELREHIVRLLQ